MKTDGNLELLDHNSIIFPMFCLGKPWVSTSFQPVSPRHVGHSALDRHGGVRERASAVRRHRRGICREESLGFSGGSSGLIRDFAEFMVICLGFMGIYRDVLCVNGDLTLIYMCHWAMVNLVGSFIGIYAAMLSELVGKQRWREWKTVGMTKSIHTLVWIEWDRPVSSMSTLFFWWSY